VLKEAGWLLEDNRGMGSGVNISVPTVLDWIAEVGGRGELKEADGSEEVGRGTDVEEGKMGSAFNNPPAAVSTEGDEGGSAVKDGPEGANVEEDGRGFAVEGAAVDGAVVARLPGYASSSE